MKVPVLREAPRLQQSMSFGQTCYTMSVPDDKFHLEMNLEVPKAGAK